MPATTMTDASGYAPRLSGRFLQREADLALEARLKAPASAAAEAQHAKEHEQMYA